MRALLALVLAAALLAGCTSSGHKTASAPPSSTAPGAALAKQLRTALSTIHAAHLGVDVGFSGQSLAGQGDETLRGGQMQALRVDGNLPGFGSAQLLNVGGKLYAKLPAALNPGGKPYIAVTPASRNQTVQLLQPVLTPALTVASLGNLPDFVDAADSVTTVGKQSVNGTQTTHYKVVVDVAKLPAASPARDVLSGANVHTLPVQLYVDSAGRPAEITSVLPVAAQKVQAKIVVSRFDEPVTITAPPASQVDTG
jgi:hypothetical protein